MILAWWREIAIAAALAFAGLQTVRLSGEEADHFRTKAAHAVQLQRLADGTTKAAKAAQAAQQAHQQAVASIDTQRTGEKDHALSNNDALRAADSAGTRGLRVPAACPARPASPASVPSTAAPASVDPAPADIPAAFRQELWDLRAALITEQAQLLALQDYARQCSAQGVKP